MKSLLTFFLFCMLIAACSTPKITTFIDGKQLFHKHSTDWTTTGDATWHIKDGVISATGVLGYAVTTQEYSDFVMEAEFFPDEKINSGIFIRCPKDVFNPTDGYEINIADNHENQDFRTGAIVTKSPPLANLNSVGKWNKYLIRAEGSHIQVWLNGVKTGDVQDNASSTGYIGLQLNGDGKIMFRNVRIKSI